MCARNDSSWDVIVIGAGASGLMCAAGCGERGRSVLVVDHAPQSGAKIRVSGGGRCNFTNREVGPSHYRSENPRFAASALARFPPQRMIELVERHGIRYREREDGQLFCDTSAREIVALLEGRCREAGAQLRLGCRIDAVRRDGGFALETSRGPLRAASLVVATGGLSCPKLGASGFGLDLARQFGLAVVAPRPALVPFVFAKADRETFGSLAGVSLGAAVRCGGREFSGKLLFTHRGLSGPVALQASLFWEPGEPLVIDLAPGEDLSGELLAMRGRKVEPRSVVAARVPKRLAALRLAQLGATLPLDQTPERELRAIAGGFHAWTITPGGTEGYTTAEVTAGGVDTAELSSKTMEAKRVPGLSFVGEVVDVTGALGGYNLHWAWASGFAAGQHA